MIVLWIKALHVVAMVAWMAGLFYLPRLFVYHTRQAVGSSTDALFKHMEERLIKVIMRPAGVVTVVAGSVLVTLSGFSWGDIWLVAKLFGVIGMIVYHVILERYVLLFAGTWRGRDEKFFRIINEFPTLLLIWIVVWVIVKPYS
jgi:protoporphyrinogen IX oxidase